MTLQTLIPILFLLAAFGSCNEIKNDNSPASASASMSSINKDSLQEKLNGNIHYIANSLLNNKKLLVEKYIAKYQTDSCGIVVYEDSTLKTNFEGVKDIGDINDDKIIDTLFVMPPFNYCDDGYSYSFFDTSLPRLYTDSYCCHPDNLFSIGDINEDGTSEICIFYSSCVSRSKSLIAYSLTINGWKQIGRCTFDVEFMIPNKEQRVRKISKGKFEMLEIVDAEKNKEWRQFSL